MYETCSIEWRRLPPEELEALGRRSQELLGAALGRLAERWDSEQLPELRRYTDDWRAFDLGGASLPRLLAHFDQTIERIARAIVRKCSSSHLRTIAPPPALGTPANRASVRF